MKKFSFNLESVLNYRLTQEEQAKLEFGKAKMHAAKQKKLLQRFQQDLELEQESISPKLDLSLLQHKDMYINCLCKKIEHQEEEVEKAETIVNQRQVEVTKAMQDTKVLDNLKEKRYQEYLAKVNRQEQKLMDEIGLTLFARKASNE